MKLSHPAKWHRRCAPLTVVFTTLLVSACVSPLANEFRRSAALAEAHCRAEGGLRTFAEIPEYIDLLTPLYHGGDDVRPRSSADRVDIGRSVVQTGEGSLATIVATADPFFLRGQFSFAYLSTGRIGAVDLLLTNLGHPADDGFFNPPPDELDGYYRYSLRQTGDRLCRWSQASRARVEAQGYIESEATEFFAQLDSNDQCLAIEFVAVVGDYRLDGFAVHLFFRDLLDEPVKQTVERLYNPSGDVLAEWRNFRPLLGGHSCGNRIMPLMSDLGFR